MHLTDDPAGGVFCFYDQIIPDGKPIEVLPIRICFQGKVIIIHPFFPVETHQVGAGSQ
ncbi:hypothetical protein Barb7_02473 [Bacteroidales bacterium Barb7]|nr:hypothetical protein Barb7_02473 [Bacteroidales bacterium Barb7]